MEAKKAQFLAAIESALAKNPDWVSGAMSAVMRGTVLAHEEMRNQLGDCQNALTASLSLVDNDQMPDEAKQALWLQILKVYPPEHLVTLDPAEIRAIKTALSVLDEDESLQQVSSMVE